MVKELIFVLGTSVATLSSVIAPFAPCQQDTANYSYSTEVASTYGMEAILDNFLEDTKGQIITISKEDIIGETKYKEVEVAKSAQKKSTKSSTKNKKTESKKSSYTSEELDLLARLVEAEAGTSDITDEHQQLVAMVVINRTKDKDFHASTIKEVIYAKNQYECVSIGSINNKASERAIKNAKKALEGEVDCPSDIVWQSEFPQGSNPNNPYKKIKVKSLGTTTYFCHK